MKNLPVAAMLAAVVPGLLTGCAEPTVYEARPPIVVAPVAEVVVNQPPPPPRQEVIVAPPGSVQVWMPGYWSWQGSWVWIRGHWVVAPHPHAVWVAGRWAPRGHGWVWIPGHWR